MTIKWGDPIECNGVRPDWLRDDEPIVVEWHGGTRSEPKAWTARSIDAEEPSHSWAAVEGVLLPADHPAYVALARGFHPWSGGYSAPDDWDATQPVLLRNTIVMGAPVTSWRHPWNDQADCGKHDIIGYRKRNTRFDDPHLARIEVEGSAPVEGVFIKRMTEAEARDWITNHTYTESTPHILHALEQLGLVESRAERFTRETGHAITEAVEAALNWKGE